MFSIPLIKDWEVSRNKFFPRDVRIYEWPNYFYSLYKCSPFELFEFSHVNERNRKDNRDLKPCSVYARLRTPPTVVGCFESRVEREENEITCDPYLLFPCEKATIVPELASSCRRAAAIVNSGTRRSSVTARSKLASSSRSSLVSPKVVKLNHSCDTAVRSTVRSSITPITHLISRKCN